MDRQPYRGAGRVCPFNTMAAVGGQENGVACLQTHQISAAIEAQLRRPVEDEHPFIPVLIVPLAGWRDVAARHDTFDANVRILKQSLEEFIGKVGRQVVEKIGRYAHGI